MSPEDFWWRERVLDELFRQYELGEITEGQYMAAVEGM